MKNNTKDTIQEIFLSIIFFALLAILIYLFMLVK